MTYTPYDTDPPDGPWGEEVSETDKLRREVGDLREMLDEMRESASMADSEYAYLKGLIEQGLSIDGEYIPLIIEGGLVDRSVGIDEPLYLTLPDAYDTPAVRAALIDAHRAAIADTHAKRGDSTEIEAPFMSGGGAEGNRT